GRCQRPPGEAPAIGWIEERQDEAAVASGRPEIGGVAAEDLGRTREPERLDVAADESARGGVLLHEQAEGRAPRQRLETQRARAGEQVEHPGVRDREAGNAVGKDVEDGL